MPATCATRTTTRPGPIQWVRKWYPDDYQADAPRRAELIDLARKRQWKRLPEMLAELARQEDRRRGLQRRRSCGCCAAAKTTASGRSSWSGSQDPSPLVRSSAASALGGHLTPEMLTALLAAAAIRRGWCGSATAMSLAALPPRSLTNEHDRANLEKANRDFTTAMQARPDDWASHANLGNFYMESRTSPQAVGLL